MHAVALESRTSKRAWNGNGYPAVGEFPLHATEVSRNKHWRREVSKKGSVIASAQRYPDHLSSNSLEEVCFHEAAHNDNGDSRHDRPVFRETTFSCYCLITAERWRPLDPNRVLPRSTDPTHVLAVPIPSEELRRRAVDEVIERGRMLCDVAREPGIGSTETLRNWGNEAELAGLGAGPDRPDNRGPGGDPQATQRGGRPAAHHRDSPSRWPSAFETSAPTSSCTTATPAVRQYTSIRNADRLSDAGIVATIGGVGVSFDQAMAETLSCAFKPC